VDGILPVVCNLTPPLSTAAHTSAIASQVCCEDVGSGVYNDRAQSTGFTCSLKPLYQCDDIAHTSSWGGIRISAPCLCSVCTSEADAASVCDF
jgi:hypothetical protein